MNVATADRCGRWLEKPGFGVYVHIPFCRHRCHYCDFNTYEDQGLLHAAYVDALVRSIEGWVGPTSSATSVFFGGGTPTLLDPSALARALDAVNARVGIAPGAEVTIEANPETVDEATFEKLLKAGFNRFSIGVQSLSALVLERLGRTHSAKTALDAVAAARRAGVEDLNMDLIYGSPWEGPQDWIRTLEGMIEARPDHISAYALTVEEGTPLATLIGTGRSPDVDPDIQADRYEVAGERLQAAGFERYEISNWAQPGRASRHNVLYWSGGDYLGFGAGAHGHIDGRRWWSVKLPRDFIDRSPATEAGHEVVEGQSRAGEALMLGLRLSSGIEVESFSRRFGPRFLEERRVAIEGLKVLGLLDQDPRRVRLTPRATFVANEVIGRLLEPARGKAEGVDAVVA